MTELVPDFVLPHGFSPLSFEFECYIMLQLVSGGVNSSPSISTFNVGSDYDVQCLRRPERLLLSYFSSPV